LRSQPEAKKLREICEMERLKIYSEQKPAEKNLYSWTDFAVNHVCLLAQRRFDIHS